ncbi:MAG: hypothetical protein V8R83_04285 [Candidatus Gastranaerophilaceae bacterium]
MLDSDDELAAVICHEIAHGLDAHKGLWRRLTMAGSSKSYEFKADKKGVDLMVNAGYNPIAMIVILNKITAEPSWFERYPSHPGGSERLLTIYSYIYSKYPSILWTTITKTIFIIKTSYSQQKNKEPALEKDIKTKILFL